MSPAQQGGGSSGADNREQKPGSPVVSVGAPWREGGDEATGATGSSARQTVYTRDRPCDAVVMAIVDTWEVGGDVKYVK